MIVPSLQFYTPHFKSTAIKFEDYQDENELCSFTNDCDCDCPDKKIREAIRAHIYSQFMPNYGDDDKHNYSYARTIDDVFIPNLRKIGCNSYRGATLAKKPHLVELLSKSDITTVIDLVGYRTFEDACAKNNIEYFAYPVDASFWAHPIFKNDESLIHEFKENNSLESDCIEQQELDNYKEKINIERREFMDKFIKLTEVMQNGHFYISCEHGEYRTPNVLALNTYFNARWNGNFIKPTNKFLYDSMKNMYLNLTPNEKLRLGFNEAH